MRKKIDLYIEGRKVDTSEQSFILYNYTFEDLTSPTDVKNPYTQSIEIPDTPNNNTLFGDIFRMDRETISGGKTGVCFDPSKKADFVILNEANEVLESGYAKLDNITRNGSNIKYSISLYGGLGSFIYNLSYNEDGSKRTLADLKYTSSIAPDNELSYTIRKETIDAAWDRLNGNQAQSPQWDIINFAPCFNGLPSGKFDANKAMIRCSRAGLPVPAGYMTDGGFTIVNLRNKVTEWAVKDFRSYLQRPVIKLSAIIQAMTQPYNNGGWTVNLDNTFFNSSNPYYSDTWLTLPLLDTLKNKLSEQSGKLTPIFGQYITIPGGGNLGSKYGVKFALNPHLDLDGTPATDVYTYCRDRMIDGDYVIGYWSNIIRYTLTAYNANGHPISSVSKEIATHNYRGDIIGHFNSNGDFVGELPTLELNEYGILYVELTQEIIQVKFGGEEDMPDIPTDLAFTNVPLGEPSYVINKYGFSYNENNCVYHIEEAEAVRSYAEITKQMLLSTDKTPADYLLSFVKMFGLVFVTDKDEKAITIMPRNKFFTGNIIDIDRRVDRGNIMIKPYLFDARWYELTSPTDKGEFAEYYKNLYNKTYGVQRINTGYDFDVSTKQIMDKVLYRGVCDVMENSKYYCDLSYDAYKYPSPFLDGEVTYKLINPSGEQEDLTYRGLPTGTVATMWNYINYYHFADMPQYHEGDNKAYDDRDTLIFFRGIQELPGSYWVISDDNEVMMRLNELTPCWYAACGQDDYTIGATFMPLFGRYVIEGNNIVKSLDFGTPIEVNIPQVEFAPQSDIYSQYWSKYIADRYHVDTKVVTAKVDLSGLDVSQQLLRNFYFFDGAYWVINKVVNHSITTEDLTEVEFIKVNDINNYL